MTDQVLHNDLLREIGSYWDGHRLHYTCRALHASWNPEDHLITEHIRAHRHDIITKYMPNGAYHGTSRMSIHHYRETVTYHRGQIVKSIYAGARWCTVKILIDGWGCVWRLIDGERVNRPDPSDTDHGEVHLSPARSGPLAANHYTQSNVMLRDFVAVAQKHIAESDIRGECATLLITKKWCKILPHTHTRPIHNFCVPTFDFHGRSGKWPIKPCLTTSCARLAHTGTATVCSTRVGRYIHRGTLMPT